MKRFLPIAALAVIAAGAIEVLATGGARPTIWTPSALSSAAYESTPTFAPDGRELVYMSASPDFTNWRLLLSRCERGRWTPGLSPPFAAPAPVIEADPGYTPDGKGLYFVSARHDPANQDFDIWYVTRAADGRWGTPERLPAPVNSPYAELLPRMDRNGRLYFGSSRPGGHGLGDIYVAERRAGASWRVRNLGPPVSTAANEFEAEVSHDGRSLIVVADRGNRSHLYRFDATAAGWRETGTVSADSSVFQVGPLLSPDAATLLFAQADETRSGEIFRVDLAGRPSPSWPLPCSGGADDR